ncbi:hypothetical protein NQ314_020701 [Rhamnusium bicolor]|uniref:NAD(P)H oxidase (H2O2-forming) n=1 Tax=Rhamnusium bicolor TaxID=1586634 RepID=A0AAV8WKT6_9CUCU|nr:hypothetical protein NQ314_020701 [Rhamnusium bicolor]
MANPPPPFYHAHYTTTHETERVSRFFKLGNPRGNENAFLLTFGVMWFRWHNYIADRIRHHNPKWSGEKIYNEARKWVIATQQRIVVYEWLPSLLNKSLETYNKYDPSIDPQIDQFFQSAAFRFGHTLVVPDLGKNFAVRTCNIFWRPQEPMLNKTNDNKDFIDIDRLLMGMSVQLTEEEDHVIVEDLRGNVFGPLEFPRRDLMAINIQRGRDHGLPDFNSARRAFGLEPLFSNSEIARINKISIYDIIMAVTKMDADDIPKKPFKAPIETDTNLNNQCKLKTWTHRKGIGTYFHLSQLNSALLNENWFRKIKKKSMSVTNKSTSNLYLLFVLVNEWIGKKYPNRKIIVMLKDDQKQICVSSYNGTIMRALDFAQGNNKLKIILITDEPTLIIQSIHNYDLVIKFETEYLRDHFLKEFDETFVINSRIVEKEIIRLNWNSALKIVITKDDRQKKAGNVFQGMDAYVAKEVIDTELTIREFADSLNMSPTNEFVQRMFALIDKDKNRFISFREFVDLLIIFADGTEEQKAKLLFDISFLETVGGKVDDKDIQTTVDLMLRSAGIEHKKNNLNFQDFKKMIGDDIKNLNTARLGFKGVKKEDRGSYLQTAKNTIESIYQSRQEIEARFKGHGSESAENNVSKIIDEGQEKVIQDQKNSTTAKKQYALLRFIELKSKEIFWKTLYTLVLFAIFAERAYYYSVEREHSGLRRIAGYGVTVTRGAASAMMFTYASLLVTMCRNTITYLRDTWANGYFPFDASVEFHKYIAFWAFVFTIMHIVGHAFNFYHISTQTADDLTCLFRNYFHATHELPKFHYWCWQTMTGFTGIILTLIFTVMYIFALPIIRRKIYNWFWYTHNLYPLFFIFFILHGTGRLIQPPFTYYFLLGPLILFTLDTLISVSRKKIEIPVIHADILPSNVTKLEFQKPDNFQYKAGQWVRIACLALNQNEYHPFTLSSAPDEVTLTVHIRAVGPWTTHIRSIYDTVSRAETKLPKCEKKSDRTVKKVYFIWVSRTQKQFEWLVDIIRDVETNDTKNFVSCHIFITQFYEKFDLRTIFLYICERHYQRVSNKSLFTNLRAVTHFGRPEFSQFFKTVQYIHESAKRVGVFSCGPPSMTSAVDLACSQINQQSEHRFEHHFKNF